MFWSQKNFLKFECTFFVEAKSETEEVERGAIGRNKKHKNRFLS